MKNSLTPSLNRIYRLTLMTFIAIGVLSCSDDNDQVNYGSLDIVFTSMLEDSPLELVSRSYEHAPGGSFVVDDFKYYISNIKLINSNNGNVHADEDGYYLIHKNQEYTSYSIALDEVPSGKYNRIEFSIGIDPVRNLSIDNIGDLDPNNQMAWNWNIGYKFMLLEGMFTDEEQNEIPLVFHIGADPNYRTYLLDLPSELSITKTNAKKILIQAEVEEFFSNPNTIDFNTSNTIKHSPEASELAENYGVGMFKIMSIE